MPAWATEPADWIGAHRAPLILAAGALTVLLLVWAIRRAARTTTPDRLVDGVALALTLGWSAEGMWEVAREKLGLHPLAALPGLFVFTSLMVAAMLRAARHQKVHGNPGQHGRFAWTVAVAEACVVSLAGDTTAERALRIAIPLLAVYQWWLGMVGDGVTEDLGRTSWRWTPRRLLLAVGAIEPGERDAETLDRDRLINRMTRLEYRRRHGWSRLRPVRAGRLARLSLDADDAVVAQVRDRVSRAGWFDEPAREPVAEPAHVSPGEPAHEPSSEPGAREPEPLTEPAHEPPTEPAREPVSHPEHEPVRQLTAVIGEPEPAAELRIDPNLPTEDRLKLARQLEPKATIARLAELAHCSAATVKRYPASKLNGRTPGPLSRPARSQP